MKRGKAYGVHIELAENVRITRSLLSQATWFLNKDKVDTKIGKLEAQKQAIDDEIRKIREGVRTAPERIKQLRADHKRAVTAFKEYKFGKQIEQLKRLVDEINAATDDG